MYIQKPAVFHERKNNNDLYSDHLPKKLLYIEQNVCKTFLPFAPFESYPAARFSNSSTSAVPIVPNCCLSPAYSVHTGFHTNPGVSKGLPFPNYPPPLSLLVRKPLSRAT